MNSIAHIRKQLFQISRQINYLNNSILATQKSVNKLDTNCVKNTLDPSNPIWHSPEFLRASRVQRG